LSNNSGNSGDESLERPDIPDFDSPSFMNDVLGLTDEELDRLVAKRDWDQVVFGDNFRGFLTTGDNLIYASRIGSCGTWSIELASMEII